MNWWAGIPRSQAYHGFEHRLDPTSQEESTDPVEIVGAKRPAESDSGARLPRGERTQGLTRHFSNKHNTLYPFKTPMLCSLIERQETYKCRRFEES
jgi:hypothetical protein